jgi:hypothetical protein
VTRRLGIRDWDLGSRFKRARVCVLDSGFEIWGLGIRMKKSSGHKVQGSKSRVHGPGLRVYSLRFGI